MKFGGFMSAFEVASKNERFIRLIDKGLLVCGAITLLASATILFMGVIARYFFGQSYSLFEEVSTNLVVWTVMFLGGPALKRGSHVGMEFLAQKLKGNAKTIQQLVINIVMILICGILAWKGVEIVQLMMQLGKTTLSGELAIWYMIIPVPLGGTIYAIYCLAEIIQVICAWIDPAVSRSVTTGETK